jgi:hypothetical protein
VELQLHSHFCTDFAPLVAINTTTTAKASVAKTIGGEIGPVKIGPNKIGPSNRIYKIGPYKIGPILKIFLLKWGSKWIVKSKCLN